jgi:hypothetical protein
VVLLSDEVLKKGLKYGVKWDQQRILLVTNLKVYNIKMGAGK